MKLGLCLTLLFLSVYTVSGEPFKCSNVCGKGAAVVVVAGMKYCCPPGYRTMIRRKMEDAFIATDCECLFLMPAGRAMYGGGGGAFIVQPPPPAPAPAAKTVIAAVPPPPPPASAPAPPKVVAPPPRLPTYKPIYQVVRYILPPRTWYHRPARKV